MGIYDRDWWKDRGHASRVIMRRARPGRPRLLSVILFWLALAAAFWLFFDSLGH